MRVIVADDQIEVRSALRLLLEEKAGISLISEASDETTLLTMAVYQKPDLIILDWELNSRKPGDIVEKLKNRHADIALIVLSSRPQVRAAAMRAGACGFVCKSEPPESILKTLVDCGF
jgi:DNA-binding NarL/FixJ family response regulator